MNVKSHMDAKTAPIECTNWPSSAQSPTHKYRGDIDGIRGIAVLLVIAYHAKRSLLPGGFVGVDVFFVISGYLISTIIFHDVLNQSFSISSFYERRIKRIFPSLITVLMATLGLGWLFLWGAEYRILGKHVVGGATFISNILLWTETGYFAAPADSTPLLHLWSLGVEEQFYLLYPLSIWLLIRFRPASTTVLMGTVLAISFALCSLGNLADRDATFYLPGNRLWELLLGCLLASIQNEYRPLLCGPTLPIWCSRALTILSHRVARNFASLVGVCLIIYAALFLTSKHTFPGAWALIPTVGTALLIFAGEDSLFNRRVLGHKILIGVGVISYPLYLWHWPLLVFLRVVMGGKTTILLLAGTLALTFLLAYATYRYIERPIRFKHALGARTTFWLCSGMVALLVIGFSSTTQILTSRLGATSLEKAVAGALGDWKYPFPSNYKRSSGFAIDAELSSGNAYQATLFVGDSHMQQYWPRIEVALKRLQSNACPVIMLTAAGGPPLPNVNKAELGYACDKFYPYVMQEAAKTNVGRVVFACYWEAYFIGHFPDWPPSDIYLTSDKDQTPLRLPSAGADQVFHEFGRDVAKLVGMGKEVFVILSSPTCAKWSPESLSRLDLKLSDNNRLGVLRKDFDAYVSPVEKQLTDAVTMNGGSVINPRDVMEENGFIYGRTVTGEFRYKDNHHMRPFYARESASFLDALVAAPEVSSSSPMADAYSQRTGRKAL
jgi:peptidoglycan/LPS O-acetylase OafA/YrhL